MEDHWAAQLRQLNHQLRDAFSDAHLGDSQGRRALLEARVGPIQRMRRLHGDDLKSILQGRPLVGVDGSVNSLGGSFPYYIDLIRALAKPSHGEQIFLKDLHCPIPPSYAEDGETAMRNDAELRQRKLADLEVRAAIAAIDRYRPIILLMDGPLVRFDMRTKESFQLLREKALRENVLLVGCIENIESRVLGSVLGEAMPAGWANRFDRDLLWGVLEHGELLAVGKPAKGSGLSTGNEDQPDRAPTRIRTWFMRASLDPGVVGLDMLEEQVEQVRPFTDYLFTLSPVDGRGIPIWLDIVDREVRLTAPEVAAYAQLLDAEVKRLFVAKRTSRFF